jgi:hypothetical protein
MRGMIVIPHRLCLVPLNSEQYSFNCNRITRESIFAKAEVYMYLIFEYIKLI